jgi:Toastrack DUF4097
VSYLAVESPGGLAGARGRLVMTPGRVVALVFGVPVLLALIGWCAFVAVAMLDVESYPVNVAIPVVNDKVNAQIDGNLTVRQAEVSHAQLTGIAKYSLFRDAVTTSRTATGTLVRYSCDVGVGECSLDGTLVLPSHAAVSLDTAGGDVSLADYGGNLALNLAGGNLNAGTLGGSVTVNSSGGDVSVNTLDAPVRLDTSGGNVNISAVDSAAGGTVWSDGGDVTMTFTTAPDGLTIYSNGGNVELTLPGSKYIYSVTTNGGNSSVPASAAGAHDKITVDSNGGDVTINAGN